MTTSAFNPTILFNLLVGSADAANKRNVGPILTSIRNDLRAEIERSLPVIYLWDAIEIVNTVLNVLNPFTNSGTEKEKILELSRFLSQVVDTDVGVTSFYEYTKDGRGNIKVTQEADEDIYREYSIKYNKLISNKSDIIQQVHKAILSSISNKSTTKVIYLDTLLDSIIDKQAQLGKLLVEISSLGIQNNSLQSTRFTRVIRAAGRSIRNIVSGTNLVLNAKSLITDFDTTTQVLMVAQNFSVAKKSTNEDITKVLNKIFNSYGIFTRDTNTGFKVGNFVAAGHVGFSSGMLQNINTPQLQSANILMALAGKDSEGIISRFINNTDHNKWLIKVDKSYGDKLNLVLSLGISLVRSQPSYFNSAVLGVQESSIIDKEIQNILNSSYKDALVFMQKQASNNPLFHNYLVDTFRMSPTIAEHIATNISDILTGKPNKITKSNKIGIPKLNIPKSIQSIPNKRSTKTFSSKKGSQPRSIPIRTTSGHFYSLANLQMLINTHLQDVISANMGNGGETRILNYRTGRFAASANVERMSQSREGMVTAFYTYMKNPYATFSAGGKQSNPASRDPKALIGTSIKEIAATKVGNRLRAVLI